MAAPGVYRLGHQPDTTAYTESGEPQTAAWPLLVRAVLNLIAALLVYRYGNTPVLYLLKYTVWPSNPTEAQVAFGEYGVRIVVAVFAVVVFGRMGRWREVYRRFLTPTELRRRAELVRSRAITREDGAPEPEKVESALEATMDPWAALRTPALAGALALLDADTRADRVSDVDYVRIHRVHQEVAAEAALLARFAEQVAARGAGLVCTRRSSVTCRSRGWWSTICWWVRSGWASRRTW
ncbi:hypothetical protein E6W39_27705 [Kitasatospora acidiphila]|uniref:Uncharacterized protein n=1 Tax=Kitasatospora acidiphila TaxID=2567942 RepID=A0A540W8K7_9ACTN|nr:hypothetical protein [Kitasatospora acidiphila]TQF05328.1 hypothetical protein E6W39_27705 [Kitasatospora acidiphila]